MKIGLLGGSFNPITKAHLSVARAALKYLGADSQVWFSPCYVSLYQKTLVRPEDRLNMCQLAIESLAKTSPEEAARMWVCPFEIENKLTGETADALPKFMQEYHAINPDYQFYFIIGFDNAIKIRTWGRWREVISMIPFLVFPRDIETDYAEIEQESKSNGDHLWYLNEPHIYADDHPITPISSTRVRNELETTGFSELISSSVYEYIAEHELYSIRTKK